MALHSARHSCLQYWRSVLSSQRSIMVTSMRYRISTRRRLENLSMQKRVKRPLFKNDLSNLEPLTDILTDGAVASKTLEENRDRKLTIYKQYLPPKYNTVLLEALLSADSIHNLLLVVGDNLNDMNSFLLAVSFEAIADQLKLNSADPDTVLSSPEFRQLCTKSLYRMRFMEPDEVLKVLECLSLVNMSPHRLITACTLQMIRYSLNEFNMKELRYIDQVLEKMDDPSEQDDGKSLLKTIKKALPIAYQRQIKEKLFVDRGDTKWLPLDEARLINKH